MTYVRLVLRSGLLVPYLTWGFLLGGTIYLMDMTRSKPIDTTAITWQWLAGLCWVLDLKIERRGELDEGSSLIVANHISWLDIPVLGAIKPLQFLSKAEVRSWPLIGFLAERAGTLFIKRGGGQVNQVQTEIESVLEQGKTVLIFPEGTTTDGQTVKKFHPRLFKSALKNQTPVQPVTLHYRRQGTPDSLAPFIGDDEFFSHLIRLLKAPPTQVYVVVHPAIRVNAESDALGLAQAAHDQVEQTLTRIVWQNKPYVPVPVYPVEGLAEELSTGSVSLS